MYRVAQIPLVLADDPPEDRLRPEFLSFARTGFRRCDKKCSASIDAYRRGRWPATNSRETHPAAPLLPRERLDRPREEPRVRLQSPSSGESPAKLNFFDYWQPTL